MKIVSALLIQGVALCLWSTGSATGTSDPTDLAPLGPGVQQASGKLSLLRVHDVGTRFGPPSDEIDVEVVIRLDSAPTRSFGFQLRDDSNRPARQAMFDLMRDAFQNDWTVTINYTDQPGRNNSVLFRVWLTR